MLGCALQTAADRSKWTAAYCETTSPPVIPIGGGGSAELTEAPALSPIWATWVGGLADSTPSLCRVIVGMGSPQVTQNTGTARQSQTAKLDTRARWPGQAGSAAQSRQEQVGGNSHSKQTSNRAPISAADHRRFWQLDTRIAKSGNNDEGKMSRPLLHDYTLTPSNASLLHPPPRGTLTLTFQIYEPKHLKNYFWPKIFLQLVYFTSSLHLSTLNIISSFFCWFSAFTILLPQS